MPFVAVEQLDAQLTLEGGDRSRQRGLGEVQTLGGDPVIQGRGERREMAQAPQFHSALQKGEVHGVVVRARLQRASPHVTGQKCAAFQSPRSYLL
ncbi:hypothetical protein GCM10027200_73770 [Lentzea nigeriaca]